MSEVKEYHSHAEAINIRDTSHGTHEAAAEHATKELYHDGVIVLDVTATSVETGGAGPLKLAKNGHV